MTQNKLHGRDYAVAVLNEWYDKMGVLEEDRVTPEYSIKDKELLDSLPDDLRGIEEEKLDGDRELIIKAIRKGRLTINEDNTFTYKLAHPTGDREGKNLCEEVTITRAKMGIIESNSVGLKANDMQGFMMANVAAHLGISRLTLKAFDKNDFAVCAAVSELFSKAD
jgi:hypothetical protein